MPGRIVVTVERSRVPMRCWLKACGADGHVEIIRNIPTFAAVWFRNRMLERLSEIYDDVYAEPLPWVRPEKE